MAFNVQLVFNIVTSARLIAYADDVTLLITGTDPVNIVSDANNSIFLFKQYMDASCQKMNPNKTLDIFFSWHRNKLICVQTDLYLDNHKIKVVREIISLCVYFSAHLTWDVHVNHVRTKLTN